MKKIFASALAALLALAVCLSFAACGNGEGAKSQTDSPGESSGEESENVSEESSMDNNEVISVAAIPEGVEESKDYTVTVKYGENGEEITVPCYPATVGKESVSFEGAGEIKTGLMSFCYFESDFDEMIYITVTPSKPFESCAIRPTGDNISFEKNGDGVTFALGSARKLSVEFDDEIYTNLFIYADEYGAEKFTESDENVVYYAPGVHNAGEIKLQSNQTLYLAPGAVVYGYVTCADAENVAIKGRGILSGANLSHRMDSARNMLCTFDRCKGVTVDGVIFIDSPAWTLRTYSCDDVVIKNLKEICWYYNSDGIDVCGSNNVTITDCFLRNYDDNISLKAFESRDCTNITVTGCVFWADCAHNMLVGPEAREAEYENKFTDITFKNITVLEQNQKGDFYKGVMAITCADNAVFNKIIWENIKIERMSDGAVINFRFSDDYATYFGKSINGVTVKNVDCACTPARGDTILGLKDNPISEINIINYKINGKKITFAENNFSNDLAYVDSLKIDGDERKITVGIDNTVTDHTPYVKVVSTSDGFGAIQAKFAAGIFEAGKTYTIKTTARFEGMDPSVGADTVQGLGYVNCYVYKKDGNLDSFNDFAKCNTGDIDWKKYEAAFRIPENPGAVTVTIGFWEAAGTVCCSEVVILDSNGVVIFKEDFSAGLDSAVWQEIYKAQSVEIVTEEKLFSTKGMVV